MLDTITDVLFLKDHNTRVVVISVMLLGVSSGVIGAFLLLRKRSLMGDVLSHATLPGLGLAFATMTALGYSGKSLPGLLLGATISGALGLLLMLAIRSTTRLRDDVAMGFVLSVFFGLGVAVLGMVQKMPGANAAGLESFIYGKTASMVLQDAQLIGGVALLISVLAVLFKKEFTLICFDDGYAAAQGWPVILLDVVMLALVTCVTVIGLQAVGLILIIAFLIIPATAARFWTHRLEYMILLAALIGALSGWLGASFSGIFGNMPAGAIIVLVAATIFLFSMFFGRARGLVPRLQDQLRLKRRVGRQHLLRAAYEILEQQPGPLANVPVDRNSLFEHRSWSRREFNRFLAHAQVEDHLETCTDDEILLSESGFGEAARMTRNHRLWELYLIRHADIAPSHVDRDADMVEHILGAEMVRQLEVELGNPGHFSSSPHTISSK
ncbi:iron chelate uptake ABC transporter family permease subunit [Coraliomargarita algicola]|uniref:Iron chelate uptake ABC transporter family permease subunit n=1 Tax=Coraliomargarita algicola TaxID=3092156 RepID=A0ABZ0RSN5_9BACT|nr:iron chelate uptake ABC transporter family permease subunit [Coraliomargarita sp. J2-16]WPJ97912.1 iron chelate uptake ABC transporter family permease subunit [Coraliomargarita sp. J2-16]